MSGFSSRHQYVNEYRVRFGGGKISNFWSITYSFLRLQYVFKVDCRQNNNFALPCKMMLFFNYSCDTFVTYR
jgi:hypothetical protein